MPGLHYLCRDRVGQTSAQSRAPNMPGTGVDLPTERGTAYRRLLARIGREFATIEEPVEIAGRQLRFLRVRDPDAVLDEVCRQEELSRRGIRPPRRTLRMPYWAAVWESALGVGQYLATRDATRPLAGVNALDLGCGMGLAGMAMASLGARVTLVDVETACLLFARLNTLPWADRCRVRRCDWQQDDLGERFELIVGSDVLYEQGQWDFIEPFLRRHLTSDGTVIIGEPGRPKAEAFPDWIRARGWSVTVSCSTHLGKTINVFELCR